MPPAPVGGFLFALVPLRLSHPYVMGSFQRVSALRSSHLGYSVAMPLGRDPCGGFRLYTLRRAQPLSMCRHTGAGHSCHRFRLHDRRVPFPSPDPLGTLGLPGIVSFHSHSPHGGCDPPARMCGVCTPASAGVEEEIEEANGSAGAYAPTLPLSHRWHFNFHRYVNTTKFFMR